MCRTIRKLISISIIVCNPRFKIISEKKINFTCELKNEMIPYKFVASQLSCNKIRFNLFLLTLTFKS